jgi:hypothetical protein
MKGEGIREGRGVGRKGLEGERETERMKGVKNWEMTERGKEVAEHLII